MNPFLDEYNCETAVRRYTSGSAGKGIDYLVHHVYGPIYLDTLRQMQSELSIAEGLRILEFGCGGAMNLIYLLQCLERAGVPIDAAYGTDFSESMIKAAEQQARAQLRPKTLERTKFAVASNEKLRDQLGIFTEYGQAGMDDYFHLIFGINTFRYCWRLEQSERCASDIYRMLVKGGSVIIIDMNRKFPYYLSKVRNLLHPVRTPSNRGNGATPGAPKQVLPRQTALPSVEDYADPFRSAGFEILRKDTFCWIPHSSGSLRMKVCRTLTPILDTLVPRYAMRALVIARKPAQSSTVHSVGEKCWPLPTG